jgi:hypothetical protein
MLRVPDDLRAFAELLNSHGVRYLVVGGYAVSFHALPRMTGDIDFFVECSAENAAKLEAVVNAFGFGSLGLSAADFCEPGMVVQLGFPPNRIDVINEISGVSFAEAWPERVEQDVDGLRLVFISKPHLIANKAATARPKDLADLDALS